MKQWLLVLTFIFLSCVKSPAPTYNLPISSASGNVEMLGSQFSPTELTSTFFPNPFPTEGDQVFFWDVATQYFSTNAPAYDSLSGNWVPDLPVYTGAAFPRGAAFFYGRKGAPAASPIIRNIVDPIPTPLSLTAGMWYALSAQKPMAAGYGDLVGDPAAVPHAMTYIWPWDITSQDFDKPYRYFAALRSWKQYVAGAWVPATPNIPIYHGAFVGWFQNSTTNPMVLSLTVLAETCPSNVTARMSFRIPVDPIQAANPANYIVSSSPNGIPIVGIVNSATLDPADHVLIHHEIVPAWHGVILNCTLQSQPGNTYYVIPQGVTSFGGFPNAMTLSLPNCVTPTNDAATTATSLSLTSPGYATAIQGSLRCANNTPAGAEISLYPTGAGPDAKDVWYKFTPEVSGTVVMDTCAAPPSGCFSDTVIAVYQGFAGALYPIIAPWNNNDDTNCAPRSKLTCSVKSHTTYYIRVSGRSSGTLPGDFTLSVQQTPIAPANLTCNTAQIIPSSNRSTPFTAPANTSVWFQFTTPPGAGPWLTEVDACSTSFSSAVNVFSGACPGVAITPTAPVNCPATPFRFMATANTTYRVRVDNLTAAEGCGFLRIASGIPTLGTIPAAGACVSKSYAILGTGSGSTWSWSLTMPPPCALNIQGTATNAPGDSALQVAGALAGSINANGGGIVIATAEFFSNAPSRARVKVCFPAPCAANALVLKVGPAGSPTCWVNRPVLTSALAPCNFNPDIFEENDPSGGDVDCNGNGQPDYMDILLGISKDANGDGIPDECQGCVGAVIIKGPDSTMGYVGGNATLAVEALGSGPFNYQWRKSGTPLAGQTRAALTLSNLPFTAAGSYDVIVTNACGGATSPSAVLVVNPQPVLNITNTGANVSLSWANDEYRLQANLGLVNPSGWMDITNASPVSIPLTNSARYFRLKQIP